MAAQPSAFPAARSTLAIRVSTLLWSGLALGFLAALPVLLGATWLLLPVLLALAALLGAAASWAWRRISRPARARGWRGTWLRSTVAWWLLLCAGVAAPFYYLAIVTETRPAAVPTVTLTNGPRTVVLQGMQHVGAERFFQAVIYDLENALADGYVLAYEGVANSDAEADAWFRDTLTHGRDLGGSYRELGKTCGLSYQIDYFGPMVVDAKAHPERHATIDVDTRAMKQEYDRLMRADASFAAAMRAREGEGADAASTAPDVLTTVIDWQKKGDARRQALAGTLCRGVMTLVMRRANEGGNDALNPVILDFRNRNLATQLLSSAHPKIYVTYGAAHLPGVMDFMKREPGWKVVSVKWMRTITAPEHLEGRL
jgi:hypothetical protein